MNNLVQKLSVIGTGTGSTGGADKYRYMSDYASLGSRPWVGRQSLGR